MRRWFAGKLAVSRPGELRVGPIRALPTVLHEFGIRPQRAYEQAGVDPALFDDADNRAPLETIGRLLETCAALTACPHFGLLVGDRFQLKDLGPLGYLLRNCATVGDAVRSLVLHLHVYDRGAAPVLLARYPASMLLGYSVYGHGLPGLAHIYDAAIAIGNRMMGELCGPKWKARSVHFAHRRPQLAAAYRRVFRTSVLFDAETTGIVFASSWMQRPIDGADPALRDFIAAALNDATANGSMSLGEKVQCVLPQLVLSGSASATAVAQLFGMQERTLRRRLAEESKSLQHLINEARFERARQLLSDTELSVAQIAAALHYADPNVFSRAFRNWAKVSPSQWRSRSAAA